MHNRHHAPALSSLKSTAGFIMGGRLTLSAMMVLAGALTTLLTKYQVCHPCICLLPLLQCAKIAETFSIVGSAMYGKLQLVNAV